jgi:hypothetical protein
MLEWYLDVTDVEEALSSSRMVEEYQDGTRLLLGRSGVRPIHLVVRIDDDKAMTFVITLYEPDPLRWDASFERRIDQ